MNTFLVILWVVGIVVVVFGMLVALLAMNWSTRDNTAETMVETLLMSVSIIFYAVNSSDVMHTAFEKIYGFVRICMGLKETDAKIVPAFFHTGNFELGTKLAIGVALLALFIRYIVSADEKLRALVFLPIMLLINSILVLAVPDRFVVTILPLAGILVLAIVIASAVAGSGSSSGTTTGGGVLPPQDDDISVDPFERARGKSYHSLVYGNDHIFLDAEYDTYVILRDEKGNVFRAVKSHDGKVRDENGHYYDLNDF